MINRKKF